MKRLCLEADELGRWHQPHGPHECWQDLGAGLLMTLAKEHGYPFDSLSLKVLHSWAEWRALVKSYNLLCMNVRSWRFRWARQAAQIAKAANPDIQIWVGGMHCTAATEQVKAVTEFDCIVTGQGEEALLMMLEQGTPYKHVVKGKLRRYANPDDLPFIDRELWPRNASLHWPLEGPTLWQEGKTATVLTSRACPFDCTFCACEQAHFGATKRRSVDSIIEELNWIDRKWGPIATVVFHDSLFFQQPSWLEEFAEKYAARTPNWPYWAATRPDLVVKWPDHYRHLIEQTNWRAVSIGLESGSDNILQLLGKGFGVDINYQAIAIMNSAYDRMVDQGRTAPVILANLLLAVPEETPEDARATLQMASTIKHRKPGLAYYSPYPGTVLGDRLIAEGVALGDCADFAAHTPKCKGVDYIFYDQLVREYGLE